MKDEGDDFFRRQVRDEIFMNQARIDRATTDRPEVDPPTVVTYIDDDRILLSACLDSDLSNFGLARREPVTRRLESVVDGIPDEVHQRIAEPVENRSIELEFSTDDLDLDSLSQFFGHLTRGPRKIVRNANQRGRAQLENPSLKLCNPPVDAIESIGHIGILCIACNAGAKLARTENDLTDRRQESIQGLRPHPDGRIQGRYRWRSRPLRRNGRNRFRRNAHRRHSSRL